MQVLERSKNEKNFLQKSHPLNNLIRHLKQKEQEILKQINSLCKLLNIAEPTVSERIRQLSINVETLLERKQYRIKSKVQTYDLRDCEEYYGIIALEGLLKQAAHGIKGVSNLDLDTIRR